MNIESMRKDFEARFPVPEGVGWDTEHGRYVALNPEVVNSLIICGVRWEAWQASKEQAVPCVWAEDENGVYETGCGNLFEITAGTPADNDMRFCPYCGGELAAAPEVK